MKLAGNSGWLFYLRSTYSCVFYLLYASLKIYFIMRMHLRGAYGRNGSGGYSDLIFGLVFVLGI